MEEEVHEAGNSSVLWMLELKAPFVKFCTYGRQQHLGTVDMGTNCSLCYILYT